MCLILDGYGVITVF